MTFTFTRRSFIASAAGALAASSIRSAFVGFPAMLDHILLGCSDLDDGISFVKQQSGVTAAFGGVHPGRGTRNALLSLGGKRYLEIIAPDPAQTGVHDHYGLGKLTEPLLVGWAAHPNNLDEFASRLRAANLAFDGPTPGSRKRPDGQLLQWKTINLRDDLGGLLPFFIEWNPESIHPSTDAPFGGELLSFRLSAPNDSELQQRCNLLGLDVSVTQGVEQLYADIAGPHRHTKLTSRPKPQLVAPDHDPH